MDEKELRRIALICSLVGMVVVFILSWIAPLDDAPSEFSQNDQGKMFRMVGQVIKIDHKNETYFLTITREVKETIRITSSEDIPHQGDVVEIVVKPEFFEGREYLDGKILRSFKNNAS